MTGKIPVAEMPGKQFGRLLVNKIEREKGKPPIAFCTCSCGKEYQGRAYHIRDGKVQSCGCLNNEARAERTLKDLTGKRFGRLVVVGRGKTRVTATGQKKTFWKCDCDCGRKDFEVGASNLNNERTTSCGCYRVERTQELFTENLLGQRFDRLVVYGRSEINVASSRTVANPGGRVRWDCKCDCGNDVPGVKAWLLKGGETKSCGCIKAEAIREANSKPVPQGHQSGLLTVVRQLSDEERSLVAPKSQARLLWYECNCKCGNTKNLPAALLRGDIAQISCGCIRTGGTDSYKRFISEPEYASSRCFLYLAETIFDDCVKIGISKNPENRARDSEGVYGKWRLLAPMRRDMCWLIEQLLLRETKSLFRKPSAMKPGWGGQFELRKDRKDVSWYLKRIKHHQAEINLKGFQMICIENLLTV